MQRSIFKALKYSVLLILFAVFALSALPGSSNAKESILKKNRIEKRTSAPIPPELIPALIEATKNDIPEAYHIKKAGRKSLEAKNPAQTLDFRFSKNGIRVSSGDKGRWTMRLASYAFDANTHRIKATRPKADGIRVEYNYKGITEWYMNSPYGLEQGFTVEKPKDANAKELKLSFDLDGKGEIKKVGNDLLFISKDGGTVRYGGLKVIDANGQELTSHLTLDKMQMAINVNVTDAVYPITVDPLFTDETKLLASDGETWDIFGISVAIDGDYAIVGASRNNDNGLNSGSAYIFMKTGATWSEQAKLLASDGVASDQFGWSVSIDGDYAIVGALYKNVYQGSAYVFMRTGTTWSEQAKLLASDGAISDFFGDSVSIDGDYAIVGAPYSDSYDNSDGAAYVFMRTGTTWAQQAKLFASDGAANDYFGSSVSIDGDYVIVGAPYNNTYDGAAYVFTRTGTTWSEQAKFQASTVRTGWYEYFGSSVSISGDYAIVGAPYSNSYDGAAYVFMRTGTTWSEQATLMASDGAAYDSFGWSVSIDGANAIIGSIYGNRNEYSSGAAYLFTRTGTAWSEEKKLFASDGAANNSFGTSVSIDGDSLIVGAHDNDDNGNSSGAAYIFSSPCTDYDGDGICDDVDSCPLDPNNDIDNDGLCGDVDSCPLEDATGFDVDNDGCIDSATGIADIIDTLLATGVIDATMSNSLLQKIKTASNSLDKDNICAGIKQFEALINQVNAQRDKKISDEAADEVVSYVQSVIYFYLVQLPIGESC